MTAISVVKEILVGILTCSSEQVARESGEAEVFRIKLLAQEELMASFGQGGCRKPWGAQGGA